MGNVKEALRLTIDELDDVDKAIEFCKEQDDAELWEDLIESSIKKPGERRKSVSEKAKERIVDSLLVGSDIQHLVKSTKIKEK